MIDLVALPIWVGALISEFHLDAQQAGGIVTLFLGGGVAASALLAPQIDRLNGRLVAAIAFAAAAFALLSASSFTHFGTLALLHLVAGLATGAGLTCTHGAMGRSSNPHRIFGMAGAALGIFGLTFLGTTTKLVQTFGGATLFHALAAVMALAAAISALAFPTVPALSARGPALACDGVKKPSRLFWFGIVGMSCIATVQAMVFSFMERMATAHGLTANQVVSLLTTVGVINVIAATIASTVGTRLPARIVVVLGPVVQGMLAVGITTGGLTVFVPASLTFVAAIVFTHTFVFGLLARLEPSGKAVAGTPAMTMVGSAIGPIFAGTLVTSGGYEDLGLAAAAIDGISCVLMACLALGLRRRRDLTPEGAPA